MSLKPVPPSSLSVSVFNSYVVPSQMTTGSLPSYQTAPFTEWRNSEKTEQFVHLLQTKDLHPLIEIFKIIVQEENETIKQALRKPEGYFHRLFSNESWEEWSEYRTPLGKVVNAFANYVTSNSTIENHLNFDTLQQANTQAECVLKQLHSSENIGANFVSTPMETGFTSFGNILSKIVNFNLIPGAQASSTKLDSECLLPETDCKRPIGPYLKSCLPPTITYLPSKESCLLETQCSSMLPALPPQDNVLEYKPEHLLMLENQNGTLTVQEVLKVHLSAEEVNIRLNKNFEEMQEVERDLNNPKTSGTEREKLELKKEGLTKQQAEIFGRLFFDSAITLNDLGCPAVFVPRKDIKLKPFSPFQELSAMTGGVVGYSSKSDDLPRVIEKAFDHFLQNTESGQPVDIAFILDATSTMHDDIEQVKKNLITLLGYLKKMKNDNANSIRVAILEYRNFYDDFLNRVNTDFTSDLGTIATGLNEISTGGSNDSFKATYDALLAAKSKLSWNKQARGVAMVISDAPPDDYTVDARYGVGKIIDEYRYTSTPIYPIITRIKIT